MNTSMENPFSIIEIGSICIHTCANMFGIFANCLLFYLIYKKTPKELNSYSILLYNFAVTDTLACVSGLLVQERILTPGLSLIFIPYGPCTLLGTVPCFVTHCFMMHMYTHSLWSLLVSFIFRFLILRGRGPTRNQLMVIILLVYFPSFFQFATCVPARSPLESLLPILSSKIPEANLNGRMIMGCEYIFEWKTSVSWLHMLVPVTPVYVIILSLRYRIIRVLTVASMSERTKRMHRQLLKALTYQACLPATFAIGFVAYFIGFFGIHYEILEHLTYVSVGMIPVLSPLASLIFVRPYRVWITQYLTNSAKNADATATTSGMGDWRSNV